MRHRAAHTLPVLASALAVTVAICGCANNGTAATSTRAPVPTTAPVYGPHGADPACADVHTAEQTLQAHQIADQNDQPAIDQDFTDFAQALGTAAQHESSPAKAKAMTALSDDYSALVESQSGAAQLPDMTTVENDGTALDKACS
jgi:hypothetical protein